MGRNLGRVGLCWVETWGGLGYVGEKHGEGWVRLGRNLGRVGLGWVETWGGLGYVG